MSNEVTFRKNKAKNPFVNFFANFGLRQATSIGLVIGAIVAFIGFFTHDIVLLVGVCIMTAASICGIVIGVIAIKNASGDKKNPLFKGGLEMLIMMSVFVIIGLIGIVYYFI